MAAPAGPHHTAGLIGGFHNSRALRPSRIDFDERPFIVIWESTRACQLACKHCRAHAAPRRDPHELDTAATRAVMDQVAGSVPAPVLRHHGRRSVRTSRSVRVGSVRLDIGLPVAVSPSGTDALNRRNLEALREAGCHAISLLWTGPTPYPTSSAAWQAATPAPCRVADGAGTRPEGSDQHHRDPAESGRTARHRQP